MVCYWDILHSDPESQSKQKATKQKSQAKKEITNFDLKAFTSAPASYRDNVILHNQIQSATASAQSQASTSDEEPFDPFATTTVEFKNGRPPSAIPASLKARLHGRTDTTHING